MENFLVKTKENFNRKQSKKCNEREMMGSYICDGGSEPSGKAVRAAGALWESCNMKGD
jgi:hypothetical protein